MLQSEPTKIEISEYTGDGEVKTRIAHVTRQSVRARRSFSSSSASMVPDDDDTDNDAINADGVDDADDAASSSGETEGADTGIMSSDTDNES